MGNEMTDQLVENIRSICRKKNITVSKMENDLGFSTGLISRWSRTKTSPAFDKIVAIMDYLEITYDDLMDGINIMGEIEENDGGICSRLRKKCEESVIIWEDGEKGIPFKVLFDNLFDQWNLYHLHKMYYVRYGIGWMLLVAQYNIRNEKMELNLHFCRGKGFKLEKLKEDEGEILKVLRYADRQLYDIIRNKEKLWIKDI